MNHTQTINTMPTCPHCGAHVEYLSPQQGIIYCPDCRAQFWSLNDVENVRREKAANDREDDTDATLIEGQNYNYFREEW